jgi:hypothetical protein
MVELEKRISGDWIDTREAAGDQYSLSAHLALTAAELKSLSETVRFSVEDGVLEYKQAVLRSVFLTLEEEKYQALRIEEIRTHDRPLAGLLLVILLQRLIATGVIALPRPRGSEAVSPEDLDVKLILAELRRRIKIDPNFQKHPAVKNIFMQVAIYQKEKRNMDELLPNIKEEKQATFRENFQKTFDRVFASIRKNYADILSEENARAQSAQTQEDLLIRLPIKSLAAFFNEQAQAVSRIRSTLAFAAQEKYRMREYLVRLHRDKDGVLGLLSRERELYRKLCADIGQQDFRACAHQAASRFRDVCARVLEKLSGLEEKPPA